MAWEKGLYCSSPGTSKATTSYSVTTSTQPILMEALLERQINACGTARPSRRDFLDDLKNLNLSRGNLVFRQKGSLVAMV